ncbi:O-methyltransferase-domain-containing protein [Cladochytrium replicatum]|nr:O-methyltransferase-domain-containing protein [Cladochytrium replicatum]
MSSEHPNDLASVMDMVGEVWSARCLIGLVNLGVPQSACQTGSRGTPRSSNFTLVPSSLFSVWPHTPDSSPLTRQLRSSNLQKRGLCLTTDHPTSKLALVKSWATPIHWLPWGHLEHSLKTSEPATKHILKAYPFNEGEAKVVVDVGGAHGALLTAILDSIPSARGILFDLPEVVEKAGDIARVEKVGGSFLEPVIPTDGDINILKHILHGWSDEECTKILSTKAMATMDVKMVMFGGKEGTLDEYSALFDAADLKISRVVATEVRISIIEVVPK